MSFLHFTFTYKWISVVFLFFALTSRCHAFSVPLGISHIPNRCPTLSHIPSRCPTLLYASPDDKAFQDPLQNSSKSPPPAKPKDTALKKIGRSIYWIWSYLIIIIGTLLSFGLFLNICGFGYVWQDGSIRVDSIPKLRQEHQFQQESLRYKREAMERPSNSLPR